MKKLHHTRIVFYMIMLALLLTTVVIAVSAAEQKGVAEETVADSESVTMYIGAEMVDCVGVAPQKCLLVKNNQDDEWQMFYDRIVGFEHQPGYEYQLLVSETKVDNPPADASSRRIELVEIVSKSAVSPVEAESESENLLVGSDWDLTGYGPADAIEMLLPDSKITITFDENGLGGTAGCNGYFGDYEVNGSDLSVGGTGSTMMWCEGLMDQEMAFLQILGNSNSFTLDPGTLTLHSAEGNLIFQAAQRLSLEGAIWTLGGISIGDAVVRTAVDGDITAEFKDGQVDGSAGCNQYFAGYEESDGTLSLGLDGSTMMACDEERSQREHEFLTALGSVSGYTISREILTLTDVEGNALITFQAQDLATN